jgi:hypothetical protein
MAEGATRRRVPVEPAPAPFNPEVGLKAALSGQDPSKEGIDDVQKDALSVRTCHGWTHFVVSLLWTAVSIAYTVEYGGSPATFHAMAERANYTTLPTTSSDPAYIQTVYQSTGPILVAPWYIGVLWVCVAAYMIPPFINWMRGPQEEIYYQNMVTGTPKQHLGNDPTLAVVRIVVIGSLFAFTMVSVGARSFYTLLPISALVGINVGLDVLGKYLHYGLSGIENYYKSVSQQESVVVANVFSVLTGNGDAVLPVFMILLFLYLLLFVTLFTVLGMAWNYTDDNNPIPQFAVFNLAFVTIDTALVGMNGIIAIGALAFRTVVDKSLSWSYSPRMETFNHIWLFVMTTTSVFLTMETIKGGYNLNSPTLVTSA